MEQIKDKIAKVLELARRGGTEAEADTAMKIALELLAKHNLSMSDISDCEVQDEDIIEEREDAVARQPWQGVVWYAISGLYFCNCYSHGYRLNGVNKNSWVIVGKPSNIQTVKEIARYVVALGSELSAATKQDALFRNSWRKGFASRIAERCRAAKSEAIALNAPEVGERALAIRNLYEVAKTENRRFLLNKGIRLGKGRSAWSGHSDASGYAAGRAAGDKVSLRSTPAARIGT